MNSFTADDLDELSELLKSFQSRTGEEAIAVFFAPPIIVTTIADGVAYSEEDFRDMMEG